MRFALLLILVFQFIPRCFGTPHPGRPPYQPTREWRKEILYAVMVDRFFDGQPVQSRPDSIQDYQGGDFEGIIKKLDYLKNLGVTVIVLGPVMHSSAYHGYHPMNHFEVDPQYGSKDDFIRLINAAHSKGLKVVFDLVTNHTSPHAPLFAEHPEWFRDRMVDGSFIEGQRMNSSDKERATFFGLPDLKQELEPVYQYILRFAKFWVDTGIDGFRMDAVNMVTPEYWRRLNRDIKKYAGDNFFILGEVYSANHAELNRYAPFFDALYDFRMAYKLRGVFSTEVNGINLVSELSLDTLSLNGNPIQVPFIDNHDMPRFVGYRQNSDFEYRKKRLLQAIIHLCTQPDPPYFLYGTEIGLWNESQFKDTSYDQARSPMRFDKNEEQLIFKVMKTLLELRKEYRLQDARVNQFSKDSVLTSLIRSPSNRRFIVLHSLWTEHDPQRMVPIRDDLIMSLTVRFVDVITGEQFTVSPKAPYVPLEFAQSRVLMLDSAKEEIID